MRAREIPQRRRVSCNGRIGHLGYLKLELNALRLRDNVIIDWRVSLILSAVRVYL